VATGRKSASDGGRHLTAPVFILAGEPSGDRLAASLMRSVNSGWGDQTWIGVGGPAMRAAGLSENADMDALTVFGFGAAVAAYPRLSRLADRLVGDIMTRRPKAIITVDVKGFSLRLAMRLKRRMAETGWHAPIIHCVAPTVWAWGEWRRHRVARAVDGLLCLFPFEPDYFKSLGVRTYFIGHPEAFNPVYDRPRRPDRQSPLCLTLLPGSRRSEIRHMLAPMLAAFKTIARVYPDIRADMPTLPHLAPMIRTACTQQGIGQMVTVNDGETALFDALANSRAVLAASGTVTLQTALYGVPGVAFYIAPALSAAIGRRLVRMDRVILPNALLGREVYPFLFQQAATPRALAGSVLSVLEDKRADERAAQDAGMLRSKLQGAFGSFEQNVIAAMTEWLGPSTRSGPEGKRAAKGRSGTARDQM